MEKTNNTALEIIEAIKKSKRVVTCMDARFDFDSYCATCIVNAVCKELGIPYDTYFHGIIPNAAKEIVKQYFINENIEPESVELGEYDTMIFLDTATPNHVNRNYTFVPPKNILKINLDHHFSNSFYGDLNYVRDDKSSTCTVLMSLLNEAGIKINGDSEFYGLIGMLADTGFFQFNSTKPSDLRYAADIWEKGTDMFRLIWSLNHNDTLNNMKMRTVVFQNIRADFDNKFAYSFVTQDDFRRMDMRWGEIPQAPADIINKLSGVNFVFVVTELDDPGLYNISLRSTEPDYDVSKIAEKFGGGGHKMASGANIHTRSMNEAINTVISKAHEVENDIEEASKETHKK